MNVRMTHMYLFILNLPTDEQSWIQIHPRLLHYNQSMSRFLCNWQIHFPEVKSLLFLKLSYCFSPEPKVLISERYASQFRMINTECTLPTKQFGKDHWLTVSDGFTLSSFKSIWPDPEFMSSSSWKAEQRWPVQKPISFTCSCRLDIT